MRQSNMEELMGLFHKMYHIMVRAPKFSDVTPNEFHVMCLIRIRNIKTNSHDAVRISDVARKMHMSKSALSQVLSSMEKKGYITRQVDVQDRRAVCIGLTELGKKRLYHCRILFQKHMQKVMNEMGEDKVNMLLSLFGEFTDALEQNLAQKV